MLRMGNPFHPSHPVASSFRVFRCLLIFPYFLFGMYSFTALVTDGIDS